MKKNKKSKYGMGIKGRLILCFSSMVIFVLIIVSICQILLLGFFYRRTKTNELNTAAIAMNSVLGSGNESEVAFNLSVQYSMCIRLFEYSNGEFSNEICSIESSASCMIHHIPKDILIEYCNKALENDGIFSETINITGNAPDIERGKNNDWDFDEKTIRSSVNSQTIQIRMLTDDDGNSYALVLNSDLAPLNSTKRTLSIQFWWILISTLIFATILASLFAGMVSRPLVKMTKSAKKMASGDYDTHFSVEGYKETCELADALNYAASEISKADRMQKDLIANVSHDLRTPLTMISGYAEVMRDIPGENTSENVQVIIDESKHLTNLVNDMLDLSKISSGARVPEKTDFNINEMLDNIINRYLAFNEGKGYDIAYETEGDAFVFADKTMIAQVVTNLLNNAINYSGSEKIIRLRETIDREKGKVKVIVTDNGEGIAPDKIPLIWERYYKIDVEHKRASVGTGLGLSIVKNILQIHNASFGVESRLGFGSTFWFELDISDNNK